MRNKIVFILGLFIFVSTVFAADNGNKDKTDATSGATKKSAAKSVTKSFGYEVPSAIPKRTVAGTVAVLDMLDYLGVDAVAIPDTKRPLAKKHKNKMNIGRPMTPDMERLKAAKPDFFITVENLKGSLEPQVKTAGIKTVFLKTDVYTNYLEAMKYLGKVYKKEKQAAKYINTIKAKTEKITAKKKQTKVLIVFGTPGSMSIATENSFTGSLIKVMGGQNIWTDTKIKGSYAPMNLELVKAENPDVILRLTHVSPEQSAKMFKKEFENEFWSKLDAVKNGKVYDLDNVHFAVSGNIHISEALDILDKMIFGK